jgi:DNA-nicking Smr family endonuclease
MSRRRVTTTDERALFEETIDAPKITKAAKPTLPPKKAKARKTGIDGHTAKKLKAGEIDPDGKLDLHGLTQAGAHRALQNFLKSARAAQVRMVLVVTGKGGSLKNLVPRWLAEPEFTALIGGVASAHRRHGGEGALYVYMRKR